MANEYSKAIEKHEAGKREMVERHVQDSLRGAAIIRGAQASGHDVHHGEHGVDFHVHPDVHPAAYGQAARQIESMTAHSPQVQAAIRAQNVRVFIYPEGTRLTDHTPFATLNDRVSTNGVHYEEAGGVANVPHAGARYLATSEGRRFGGADRNQVTDHEVTHAIHFAAEHVQSGKVSDRVGEAKNGRYKESLDYRARQAYDARKASGLEFPSHYGGDNHYEYFAEAGSAWHSKSLDGRDRAWMKANDPHMSKILTDVFGDH